MGSSRYSALSSRSNFQILSIEYEKEDEERGEGGEERRKRGRGEEKMRILPGNSMGNGVFVCVVVKKLKVLS